jgi:3-deoxy-D-manno-octulosonic-acid transferase
MMEILFFVYDILFCFLYILYLPIGFLRGKLNFYSILAKFGLVGRIELKSCIWIQAVSVGEVILAANIINELKNIYGYPIVLSTTTIAGYKAAKQRYGSSVILIYFPYDISLVIESFITRLSPRLFIALETEMWPNLFYCLKKRHIPLGIINGRISDKAYGKYNLVKFFTAFTLSRLNFIGAQNEEYRKRFISLGADENKVSVTGNIKFENVVCDEERLDKIREQYVPLLKSSYKLILLAASTHDPEEHMILDIYKDIAKNYRNVTLLIAPRQVSRVSEIERIVKHYDFIPQRITTATSFLATSDKVYILDTIGELIYFYAISDVCFVGGSMANHGGHNILEPMYFGKATCFGPHMHNFLDVEKAAMESEAAVRVHNAEELKRAIIQFIASGALRAQIGHRCTKIFSQGKSFLAQNMELIRNCLK